MSFYRYCWRCRCEHLAPRSAIASHAISTIAVWMVFCFMFELHVHFIWLSHEIMFGRAGYSIGHLLIVYAPLFIRSSLKTCARADKKINKYLCINIFVSDYKWFLNKGHSSFINVGFFSRVDQHSNKRISADVGYFFAMESSYFRRTCIKPTNKFKWIIQTHFSSVDDDGDDDELLANSLNAFYRINTIIRSFCATKMS